MQVAQFSLTLLPFTPCSMPQDSINNTTVVETGDSFFPGKPLSLPQAESPFLQDTAAIIKEKSVHAKKILLKNLSGDSPASGAGDTMKPLARDTVKEEPSAVFRLKDIIARETPQKPAAPRASVKTTPPASGFFTSHMLPVTHARPLAGETYQAAWVFYTLLFIVLLFTWVKAFYNKTLRQIADAFFNNIATNQLVRDENILVQRTSVILTIVFNLSLAFLIYQASIHYEWNSEYAGSGFGRFLLISLVVSFIYSMKFILLRLVGFIFNGDKPVGTYIFNIFLINNVLGMLLIPLIIGVAYLPAGYREFLIKIALSLFFAAFLYRIYRGVLVGTTVPDLPIVYLFLYLCTLEILPLMIVMKAVIP